MKTRAINSTICLLVMGMLFTVACKKKDVKPAPTAGNDSYQMDSVQTSMQFNILANDTYSGTPQLNAIPASGQGQVVINSDHSITYTPPANDYGTFTFNYTLTDDNGSTTGKVTVARGTAAQKATSDIFEKFYNSSIVSNTVDLFLYAVDGDTSYIYKQTYSGQNFSFSSYNSIDVTSASIMPVVTGAYPYSILSNGTVKAYDSGHTLIYFQVTGLFSATAKTHNQQSVVNVSGLSILYGGHKLDYTNPIF